MDPRETAIGSIAATFVESPHLSTVLPAVGYSPEQRRELEVSINRSGAEIVVDASPARLERLLRLNKPVVRISYRFQQVHGTSVESIVERFLNANPQPVGTLNTD